MLVDKKKYNPNNLYIVNIGTPKITTKKQDGTYDYQLQDMTIRIVGGPFNRLQNNKLVRYYFDSITREIYDDTPEGINLLSNGTNHRIILNKCPLLDKYDIAIDKIGESDVQAIIDNLNNPKPLPTPDSKEITDLVLLTISTVYSKVNTLVANNDTKQNIISILIDLANNYCQDLINQSFHHSKLPTLDKLNLQKKYLNEIITLETKFIEKSQLNNIQEQLISLKTYIK